MEIIKPIDLHLTDNGTYQMLDVFIKNSEKNIIKMGKALIKPGVRIPAEGMNPHDSDEYSYAIKGTLVSGTENVTTNFSEGDFSFIPRGTKHWCKNESNEDCELIWILIVEK